jgi:hypothetical protein
MGDIHFAKISIEGEKMKKTFHIAPLLAVILLSSAQAAPKSEIREMEGHSKETASSFYKEHEKTYQNVYSSVEENNSSTSSDDEDVKEKEHQYFNALSTMEQHEEELSTSSNFSSMMSSKEEFREDGEKSEHSYGMAQEHKEQAKESKEEIHQYVTEILEEIKETLQSEEVPVDVKEIAKEMKKAIKFYKKEELFADLNITDLSSVDSQTLQELQERVKQAYKERTHEIAQELLKNQKRATYQIQGRFVQIGNGQYDWVYVTASGKAYKLAGVNLQTGTFRYQPYDAQIEVDGNQIKINGQVKKAYPYVKYDDPKENGFDWVVVLPDGKLYKLEGYDMDEGTFVYTPVEGVEAKDEGEEVEVLPGTEG